MTCSRCSVICDGHAHILVRVGIIRAYLFNGQLKEAEAQVDFVKAAHSELSSSGVCRSG
jgi:hypothetical protein